MDRLIKVLKTTGDRCSLVGCVFNLDVKAVRLTNGCIVTCRPIDGSSVRRVEIHHLKDYNTEKVEKIYLDDEDRLVLRRSIDSKDLYLDNTQVWMQNDGWHCTVSFDGTQFTSLKDEDEDELY